MKGRFYRLTRDLHLYLGLFISPFVLVFSVSVVFLVHSWVPGSASAAAVTRVVPALALRTLSGRPLVDRLRPVLESMDVHGEVGLVRSRVKEETLTIPVSIPGRATTVTLDLARGEATIVTREPGLADALVTLHKSPGGHAPYLRTNWFVMGVWRGFAAATVYLTLFITVSGIYLW